jgi:WD40 repeat protein
MDGDGKFRTLSGHQGPVLSVAFSPDGKSVVSSGMDGTVRFWEVTTGQLLATCIALADGWATICSDGRYQLSGTPGGRFWWVAGLCRFEPGELDPFVPAIRRLPLDVPLL